MRRSPDILFGCFVLYLIFVGLFTIAPPPISRSNGLSGVNLIPVMRSIQCFVPDPGQPSTTKFCLEIILGNLLLFVPFGILLPLVSETPMSVKKVLTTALIASGLIEIVQFIGSRIGSPRWTDVDDVLLNVAGAVVGYAIVRSLMCLRRSVQRQI
ncbi:MAG TPA: VanZ family protein [Gemmatimonadaceae bacterium]|nr:VanZ family protein [Gemmatimonadaceae bacterium]